jgi:hypothetical protein
VVVRDENTHGVALTADRTDVVRHVALPPADWTSGAECTGA